MASCAVCFSLLSSRGSTPLLLACQILATGPIRPGERSSSLLSQRRDRWREIIFEAETPAGRRFDIILPWLIRPGVLTGCAIIAVPTGIASAEISKLDGDEIMGACPS